MAALSNEVKPEFLKSMRVLSVLLFTLAAGAGSLTLIVVSALPQALSDKPVAAIYGRAALYSTIVTVSLLCAAAAFLAMSTLKGLKAWMTLPHALGAGLFVWFAISSGQHLVDLSKSLAAELTTRAKNSVTTEVPGH